MKRGGLPKKFLSRREKNGHHRSRSSDPATHKHRPLSAETFFGLFKTDSGKRLANDENKEEKIALKITEVRRKVADLELLNLKDDHIQYALNTKYAAGDVDRAIELLIIQQKSFAGAVLPYDPSVTMLGAENREAVTCYLDALLFAMFAKLESFECMLKGESLDEAPKRLAALLRLWVNLLRSGKLIETDMVGNCASVDALRRRRKTANLDLQTQHIQDSLAACGWREAQALEQQDTSEAFAFITETLQLPLLTLKVDLFHHGKRDDADHKVVYERLLNLGEWLATHQA
ncbi:putative ubiquitin c-terminal hydrolase family protein [Eutypa lata UCREL1]|uniref:Putative ubiquitin c-terminal hydrolase family protein n=1 Tax=Eutypa lata (strain UCR-EL1) TaxID=1287681 RepID=M7S6H6_EUTLA|nr:putative ubiquitin c-terminal hydrolase family protein [Eutypa lata UCREL1]